MKIKLSVDEIVNLIQLLCNKQKNTIESELSEESINSFEIRRIYEKYCNESWKSML